MQNSHIETDHNSCAAVTGVILAGGKSTRMRRDKALLVVDGQTLFERAQAFLRRFFTQILIAGDRPDLASADIPAVADIYPGSALGGLYTGLQAAKTDWIFVLPCDMPYPNEQILYALLAARENVDAVVPRTPAGYEPVFALYHKNCLTPMENLLQQGNYRIFDFYQQIAIRYLDPPALPAGWQRALINVNTPQQLAALETENTLMDRSAR